MGLIPQGDAHVRWFATFVVLIGAVPMLSAAEPPKELRAMIEQADRHLQQGKYLEYYKLTMHPDARKASEQGGVTMERLALIMEQKAEVQAVFKRVFAHLKTAQCQLNTEKT